MGHLSRAEGRTSSLAVGGVLKDERVVQLGNGEALDIFLCISHTCKQRQLSSLLPLLTPVPGSELRHAEVAGKHMSALDLDHDDGFRNKPC